jgi:hypothetical protein
MTACGQDGEVHRERDWARRAGRRQITLRGPGAAGRQVDDPRTRREAAVFPGPPSFLSRSGSVRDSCRSRTSSGTPRMGDADPYVEVP